MSSVTWPSAGLARLAAPSELYAGLCEWVVQGDAEWVFNELTRSGFEPGDLFGASEADERWARVLDLNGMVATRVDSSTTEHVGVLTFIIDEPARSAWLVEGRQAELRQQLERRRPFVRVRDLDFAPFHDVEADHAASASWTVTAPRREPVRVRQYWVARNGVIVDVNVAGEPFGAEDLTTLIEFVFERVVLFADDDGGSR